MARSRASNDLLEPNGPWFPPWSPSFQRHAGQRRRGQRVVRAAPDRAEPAGRPARAGPRDLLPGARREGPPHQQGLTERRAADDEEAGQPAPADLPTLTNRTLRADRSGNVTVHLAYLAVGAGKSIQSQGLMVVSGRRPGPAADGRSGAG